MDSHKRWQSTPFQIFFSRMCQYETKVIKSPGNRFTVHDIVFEGDWGRIKANEPAMQISVSAVSHSLGGRGGGS